MSSSVALAIPRTGCQRLTDGGQSKECITFAAWQSPQDKTPKRVVIRVDGLVNDYKDADGNTGFPCGVVKVSYAIGGLNKEVLLDCLTQSALVVWANSVEVAAYRDTNRIAALAPYSIKPCADQTVAAAISACECGDTGLADARYLDVVPLTTEGSGNIQSFFYAIPAGARVVRLLPGAKQSDTVLNEVQWGGGVFFTANDPRKAGVIGLIESRDVTTRTAYTIPANARFLALNSNDSGDIAELVTPPFIEWIMAPASVTVQTP